MMEEQVEPTIDLENWFETERALLYDFLVRLTGDLSRSQATAVEVIQAVQSSKKSGIPLTKIRIQIYQTARNFNADCWYRCPTQILDQVYLGINRMRDLRHLEGHIEQLHPGDREIILLRYRYGFLSMEIGEIVGKPIHVIQEAINQSVLNLRRRESNLDMNQLKQFPLFPLIETETSTLALEEIVSNISKPWTVWIKRAILWSIIVTGSAFYFQWKWPNYWHSLMKESQDILAKVKF